MRSLSVVLPIYKPDLGYLKTMINSILAQLMPDDELIIHFDDGCDVPFEQIFNSQKITNIKFLPVDKYNLGVNGAFEKLVRAANSDIVVFADQDDCWVDGRLDVIRNVFAANPRVNVVALKPIICDSNLSPLSKENKLFRMKSFFPCIIYNSAVGNCLTVNRSFFLKYTSPPFYFVGLYDWHIGVIASFMNTIQFVDFPGTYWRFHPNSETYFTRYSFRLLQKIVWRAKLIYFCMICFLAIVKEKARISDL